MANFQITVDGTPATDVIDVSYDKTSGGDVGQATISVLNTGANRALFSSGADIEILRESPTSPGTFETEWVGEVTGTPSNASQRNVTLTVEAETLLGQMEFGKVSRPFIEVGTGQAVRDMITEVVEPNYAEEFITTGSDIGDWVSDDADDFELAGIDTKRLNDFGNDLLYVAFEENEEGPWEVTNTNLSSTVVPGRRVLKVDMRLIINNRGNVFEGEFEIRDADGINYVWELDLPGYAGFKTYEFEFEDADIGDVGELTSDGAVELRLDNDGGLPEDRSAAIDMIRTTAFSTKPRNTAVSVGAVETTGRTISRRLNGSIVQVATALATEDGATVYIDETDTLHYETAGDTAVPNELNITDDGSIPVISANIDRDFAAVRNRVTVQGKDDLQATFEDSASIQYYNVEAPREEPITDTSLRTRDGIEQRGRGYLNDNAWEDTAMSFTIASAKFKDVGVGQAIDVDWPPENIFGTFVVSSVGTTPEGYVTIGMTGNTSS